MLKLKLPKRKQQQIWLLWKIIKNNVVNFDGNVGLTILSITLLLFYLVFCNIVNLKQT